MKRSASFVAIVMLLAAGAAIAGQPVAGVMTFVDRTGTKRIVSLPASRAAAVPEGSADRRAEYWPHVQEAAMSRGLDPKLIDLMIRMESGYNPRAVSPKGARGIMQVLPSTASLYGVTDLFDPRENIRAGLSYFRDLMGRFRSDLRLALAAYNAGPEAVEKHGGVPPFDETRGYVDTILSAYNGTGGLKLAGGFGRPAKPARPVEMVSVGNETLISNARRSGEPETLPRLGLR